MKTSSTLLLICLAVAVLVTVLIVAVPGARDEIHWRLAKVISSADGYAGYIDTWPMGRHADRARELYDDNSWQEATEMRTPGAYEEYVQNHPNGKYIRLAKDCLDTLYWERVRRENAVESYQSYIDSFPDGNFATLAQSYYDDRCWYEARSVNTISAYLQYVEKNPQGRHHATAKEHLDIRYWERAKSWNTIASYQSYIDAVPGGRFIVMADSIKRSLAKNDDPFLAAKRDGTRKALESFLKNFPGHLRTENARTMLTDMSGRDINDLLAEGKIEVRTRGSGITEVDVEIRRKVEYDVKVEISAGTYFVCRGGAQNMVGTRTVSVKLTTDNWRIVEVPAACANRRRSIPGSDDQFDIRRSPKQKELKKLMPVLDSARVSTDVRQAAVWIVTDDADYDDLGTLVSRSVYMPFGGTRVIHERETTEAMKICDRAGIDITKKAIWSDRNRILKGLSEGSLRTWLLQKAKKGK